PSIVRPLMTTLSSALQRFKPAGRRVQAVVSLPMADRLPRFGMILMDGPPALLRAAGTPLIFSSPDETVEYARMHGIGRWMVFGDPEGWWPIYTQEGPVSPPPEPKMRVDIHLKR